MLNVNELIKEQQYLEKQLKILHKKVKEMPAGKIIYSRNGNHTKWYKSNGSNPIYIPAKNRNLAIQLALKKYYLLQIEEFSCQLKLIQKFADQYQKCPQKSSELLQTTSYKELLASYFHSQSKQIAAWTSENYEKNKKYPESLIHECIAGHYARSKSEVIIANALFTNGIPYRYECELILDNIVLYPDFTICHPKTGDIFYWEHFGLMDQTSYRENTYNKLKLYGNHQIIPSINLITTFETSNHPINSSNIQNIITEYFI